ncbi:MAG TPA: hypothetical protein VEC99_17655 [Clostridia bacterium]|nr:hypothetical protein [Clostridia bacterium]
MSSDFDATEFVDGDFQAQKSPRSGAATGPGQPQRAPTRDEVDAKVAVAQQKLAELKRVQEELERERATLEETRRRQIEFQQGRQETIQHLTRGIGLLEEAEFNARRDAEQMSQALADMRDAQTKIQAINEEAWTRENFSVELTRALTTLENARMEWNSAQLKFPILSDTPQGTGPGSVNGKNSAPSLFDTYSFGDLCRLGFALTWPLAAVALAGLLILLAVLLRR